MGMDLSGRGGSFRFNNTNWRHVLLLAHRYGWVPAGTEPPNFTVLAPNGTVDEGMTEQFCHSNGDWDGTYFTNDCQWVTDEDAANIAQALERALEDIPDEDTVDVLAESQSFDLGGIEVSGIDTELEKHLTPLDWFSGEYKQMVRDFIAYCRVGGFSIA
jgi:hypothetical protein